MLSNFQSYQIEKNVLLFFETLFGKKHFVLTKYVRFGEFYEFFKINLEYMLNMMCIFNVIGISGLDIFQKKLTYSHVNKECH